MTDKSIFVNSTNLKSEIQHVILLMIIKDLLTRTQKMVVKKELIEQKIGEAIGLEKAAQRL